MSNTNIGEVSLKTKRDIKCILLSWSPKRADIDCTQLNSDFKVLTGDTIPFAKLGFPSLLDYLRTITDVVQISDKDGITIRAVSEPKTEHIRSMVVDQKVSKRDSSSLRTKQVKQDGRLEKVQTERHDAFVVFQKDSAAYVYMWSKTLGKVLLREHDWTLAVRFNDVTKQGQWISFLPRPINQSEYNCFYCAVEPKITVPPVHLKFSSKNRWLVVEDVSGIVISVDENAANVWTEQLKRVHVWKSADPLFELADLKCLDVVLLSAKQIVYTACSDINWEALSIRKISDTFNKNDWSFVEVKATVKSVGQEGVKLQTAEHSSIQFNSSDYYKRGLVEEQFRKEVSKHREFRTFVVASRPHCLDGWETVFAQPIVEETLADEEKTFGIATKQPAKDTQNVCTQTDELKEWELFQIISADAGLSALVKKIKVGLLSQVRLLPSGILRPNAAFILKDPNVEKAFCAHESNLEVLTAEMAEKFILQQLLRNEEVFEYLEEKYDALLADLLTL